MSTKILVPYDFSKESEYSLKLGREIASRLGYNLKVLHCLDFPKYPYFESEKFQTIEKLLKEEVTEKVISDVDGLLGPVDNIEINIDIVVGPASLNILKAASYKDVQFTCMGYKEQRIPNKIGSTTRDILRFAKSSVLSLKKEVALESIKNILVVTDFNNTPIGAMENLKTIQRLNNSKLVLLYVNTRENWLTTKETKKNMKLFCEIHDLNPVNLEIIDDDTIVSGVLSGLSTGPYDLIALKLNGLSGENKINDLHLMGEVLLESTDIPILTYAHQNRY